jgi:phage terminase small subunit
MAVRGKGKGKSKPKGAKRQPKAQPSTGKMQAFIEQYFICHFNGTKAAKAAGYEGDDATLAVTASRLLRNAKVRTAIDARMETAHDVGE